MANISTSGVFNTHQQPPLPSEHPEVKSVRRRERIQFSCTLCRSKKLKCDRVQPCRSCVGRGLARSCTYVHTGLNSQVRELGEQNPSRGNNSNIQNKVNQLEELVVSLMGALNGSNKSELKQFAPASLVPTTAIYKEQVSVRPTTAKDTEDANLAVSFGRMTVEDAATKYVDSAHWTAILQGISELKDQLDDDADPANEFIEAPEYEHPCPQLLFGSTNHSTKTEIVSAMPPRDMVDRLVSKFFNLFDMGAVILHRRTFLAEYESFWESPMNMHVMWIGMLYAMIYLAYFLQEAQPSTFAIPYFTNSTKDTYREKVVQCLVLGNYTTCVPYTIQTLALYFVIEHFRYRDTEPGCWILQGIILRVAIRAGYHRDASHYPELSSFQGEMRRRLWAKLVQLDLAVSHQNGLPRMIRPGMSDTAEPRNLTDDDFSEDVEELPPSRPDTDVTAMLRVVVRNRLGVIYSEIVDLTANTKHTPYKEIMRLDSLLHKTRDKLPVSFKWRPMRESVTDDSDLVLYRIFLDVFFHAARCTLHRSYCDIARTDPRYKYSRHVCIESAMRLLENQYLCGEEMRPGGQLHGCMWMQSSLTNHDFLVGTTILCLDMNQLLVDGPVQEACAGQFDNQEGLGKVISRMRKALTVWNLLAENSREARSGAHVLRVVLEKLEKRNVFGGDPKLKNGMNSAFLTQSPQQTPPFVTSQSSTYLNTGSSTHYEDFQTNQELVDGLDWDLWDSQTYPDHSDVFGNINFQNGLGDFEYTGLERDFGL